MFASMIKETFISYKPIDHSDNSEKTEEAFIAFFFPRYIYTLGTKIFQLCTCPAGRETYNFHSSCKHVHSSLKIVCNKENLGGGGVYLMFLKFLISLLK